MPSSVPKIEAHGILSPILRPSLAGDRLLISSTKSLFVDTRLITVSSRPSRLNVASLLTSQSKGAYIGPGSGVANFTGFKPTELTAVSRPNI